MSGINMLLFSDTDSYQISQELTISVIWPDRHVYSPGSSFQRCQGCQGHEWMNGQLSFHFCQEY